VVLENGGGGIFDFLPVAAAEMGRAPVRPGAAADPQDIYTRHIATPTGLSLQPLAAAYGINHQLVRDVRGLRAALERALAGGAVDIIEVAGERATNVELHRRVAAAVGAALSPPAAAAEPAA
jgi:2-succinyl-5-enolpyruvyl-6-hydroxy-3-cyclohexene-1-carboxylate synthase